MTMIDVTTKLEEAVCICHLCQRMYTRRPMLCLCKSNAFLRDLHEGVTEPVVEDTWESLGQSFIEHEPDQTYGACDPPPYKGDN